MPIFMPSKTLAQFSTFGDLLRFLRRRVGLTQMELADAVGYSDAQISRLEQNLRPPDISTIDSLFVPALGLEDEPKAAARLLELAVRVRREDAPAPGLCPYKGLNYFEESDAELFVGREQLTDRLTERILALAEEPGCFLAIVGASGSGKSSLVRAGVIPALHWHKQSMHWAVQILTPTAHPLDSLAASLHISSALFTDQTSLANELGGDVHSLGRILSRGMDRRTAVRHLLVIDQFEEVFSLCRSEEERLSFINNLLTAAFDPLIRTTVIITLRSDFYTHCAAYPQLREALAQHQEYIGAMTDDELRRAIEEPAQRGHWEFEPGLVDLILHDIGHEPGALPLLSHALLVTWQRRRGRTMTLSGYSSSGGVRGAIAETADAVFSDQFTPEQKVIARRIFLRLTELGDENGAGDTRRRATYEELILKPEEASLTWEVLKTLADARLITTGEDSAEVAHEVLIREWPTLLGWLQDNREWLRLQRYLTEAANEWLAMQREPSLLYHGARLAQIVIWAETHADEMNTLEREFLAASLVREAQVAAEREAQHQRELEAAQSLARAQKERLEDQKLAAARLRRRAYYLTGALILTIILALSVSILGSQVWRSARAAQANYAQAQEELAAASSRRLSGLAISQLDNRPDRALLLSLEAWRTGNTIQAFDALLKMVQYSPYLEKNLFGHSEAVHSVAFTPDGAILASGSADHTIRLWDVTNGRPLGEPLQAHQAEVLSLAFSPDGKLLASGSADHTIRLWDVASRQPLGEPLRGHSAAVLSLAFSPDGSTIASGSADNTIRLWDVASRQPLAGTITDHSDRVTSLAFSSDGRLLASGSTDHTARLWDLTGGNPISKSVLQHPAEVLSVAISPDRRLLASGSADHILRLWDITSQQPEDEPLLGHSDAVSSVAFSPDSRVLASGSNDQSIRLWYVASRRPRGEPLRGHSDRVSSVIFSSDGKTLASASLDHTARLWNLASPLSLNQRLRGHTQAVLNLSFNPDGKILASVSADRTIRLWDIPDRQPLGDPLQQDLANPVCLAFSPDGKYLAYLLDYKTIQLWDIARNQSTGEPFKGHRTDITSVLFSPDGKFIATGSADKTIRLWDVATSQQLGDPLEGHTGDVTSLAFNPAGTVLASGSLDTTVRLWDVTSHQPLGVTLYGHTNGVLDLAFSPDGNLLASGSADNTIRLWEAPNWESGEPLQQHADAVTSVAFSPDGSLLASASLDGKIRLWDAASRVPLAGQLPTQAGGVHRLAFSPDGKMLAAGYEDDSIHLWDVDPQSWIEQLCSTVGRNFTQVEWELYFPIEAYRTTCEQWEAPAQSEPITLKLVIFDTAGSSTELTVLEFARQVKARSDGSLTIEPIWQAGNETQVSGDAGVIQLVMRGKADLGLANARAWDTQSITSFQALQTPFLITDMALAKAVATSTIATRMLDSITEVGVVGLTLWPEDLHHPVSLLPGTALLSPDDFSGLTVYTPSSGVSQALLRAFGANPTDLINNIQAAETGLRWGNSLLTPATATGNVTFFPDFRVLFANRLALELLSDEQLAVLHQAATAMQKKAIADQPGELQAGLAWCEKGGTIVLANAQQLADFEGAALPVREMIKEDALNAEFIAAILELKEKVEPSPGAAACKPPGAQPGLNP